MTRNRDGLPYRSHPLFGLRRATIITAVIGFFLDIFAIVAALADDSDNIPLVLLLCSLVFVLHDLVNYAAKKKASTSTQNQSSATSSDQAPPPAPNEEPDWPSKRLVIIDLILAILFQWLFWGSFFAIMNSYHRWYRSGSETLEAYANLANFAISIEHAIACWKELIARKKAAWQRGLESTPCQNCGHVNEAAAQLITTPPTATHGHAEAESSRPSLFDRFGKGKITLPKWATGANAARYKDSEDGDKDIENDAADARPDEPLLVTPDESSTEVGGPSGTGYGTLEQSVESINSVPETVVKKKDKGKKRLVEVD